MRQVIVNAGTLLTLQGPPEPRAGAQLRRLLAIPGGAVLVNDGKVEAAGLYDVVMRREGADQARIIDAGGRLVMPGFVDSHSHPVFAGPRLEDFGRRLAGETYQELAARGGGIASSVKGVRAATEDELVAGVLERAARFIEHGTTTLEAKSGYGLDVESELKSLRAIKRACAATALELVPTFLGAHAVPAGEDRAAYVEKVVSEMIPAVAREGLARFADVFCEEGYFDAADSERILAAARAAGFGLKVHADQLARSGGSDLAARLQAVSADHLDHASDRDLEAMRQFGVIGTLLPACSYFLGVAYPPARRIIESGVAVALATDFNPGSAPCWSMAAVISMACTQMRMTPEEAVSAATINGAWALGLGKTHGSIEAGKQADIIAVDAVDVRELGYWVGGNIVSLVMKKGVVVHSTGSWRF